MRGTICITFMCICVFIVHASRPNESAESGTSLTHNSRSCGKIKPTCTVEHRVPSFVGVYVCMTGIDTQYVRAMCRTVLKENSRGKHLNWKWFELTFEYFDLFIIPAEIDRIPLVVVLLTYKGEKGKYHY